MAVVFYHLGLPFQFEGFVGVDIFFVISGFLITGILYREIASGTFSIGDFYIRRVKRILPALFVVVVATVIVGVLIMLPGDIRDLGKSAFSAVISVSNVYFWYSEDASYFARSSELIPLLHTWSLGIEEQFYLIWPLALLIIYRFSGHRGVIALSTVIALLSFIYAQKLLDSDQSFSYYMLPSRAGELIIGALAFLATSQAPTRDVRGPLAESLTLTGCGLIAYSLLLSDAGNSFPGINALYPCLGAALILYGGAHNNTLVSRLLGCRPLVAIGLVSYSLYLWHWPFLAFSRYLYGELSAAVSLANVVAMFIASFLSYRYVEVPFRRAAFDAKKTVFLYVVAPGVILVPATLFLYLSNGLEGYIRSSEGYELLRAQRDEYARPAYQYDYVCQHDVHDTTTYSGSKCVVGQRDTDPRILLWGDSHAAHYVGFLDEAGKRYGFSVRNLEVGNCPPILNRDPEYIVAKSEQACTGLRRMIRDEISKYDTVILGAAWSGYFAFGQFDDDLRATVSTLSNAGVQVVLLSQVPRFQNYDRNCKLRNTRFLQVNCVKHSERGVDQMSASNAYLENIAAEYTNVIVLDATGSICQQGCSPYQNGVPIYFDAGHLSIYGSHLLGRSYTGRLPWIHPPASDGPLESR